MNTLVKIIGAIVLLAVVVVVFAILFAFPVMWLWNALMPELFGLKVITLWQALMMNLLCGFLFKSSSSSK